MLLHILHIQHFWTFKVHAGVGTAHAFFICYHDHELFTNLTIVGAVLSHLDCSKFMKQFEVLLQKFGHCTVPSPTAVWEILTSTLVNANRNLTVHVQVAK